MTQSDSIFVLLQQECFLARSCLTAGLNALTCAPDGERGHYYAAFFQLSVGIERILKLGLLLDHMGTNDLRLPGSTALKSYGHDLLQLFDAVRLATTGKVHSNAAAVHVDSEERRILRFLSRFARGARYHNLDALASGRPTLDPLTEWGDILDHHLATYASKKRAQRLHNVAASLAGALDGHAIGESRNLRGQRIAIYEMLLQPAEYREATRYAVWHVVHLLQLIVDMVVSIGDAAQQIDRIRGEVMTVPYVSEFFSFLWRNRSEVLRKRRWP